MNLHEYQAKAAFAKAGIPVPDGDRIASVLDGAVAQSIWARLDRGLGVVVKAQVHSGGRGKAGGVKRVESPDQLVEAVSAMLGTRLVTAQSGAAGLPIDSVWVETAAQLEREVYLAFLLDRAAKVDTLVVSAAGGMDIEQVAATTPERILRLPIPQVTGLMPHHERRVARFLGLDPALSEARTLAPVLRAAWRLYRDADAALLEINPLALLVESDLGGPDAETRWSAIDAKLVLDDSAAYRQKAYFDQRDVAQSDPAEERAHAHQLNYIRLDGSIGCMVNGAGLAMATMDLIALHGGRPANFLDVGGGTTAERVTAAFDLILADANVRAVLVNIFGGIVRCDLIAEGLIEAMQATTVDVPVIVRLEGTRADEGLRMLAESGLPVQAVADLDEAAGVAVRAANSTATTRAQSNESARDGCAAEGQA
ncbi:MAG: ADP-forming succinate--CoA ligase subunit beta [Thioalkalivibrionaceae bacterium]